MSSLLTEWARLLLASFAAAGVREVVLSPGSRSTPFIFAAANEPALRCHDVIDERSAGFFALGQARLTGAPSLLVCTSGSAGAHYLPAIVEAGASYLPLLVLTADRPVELQDCAAPQTIDQLKLYGGQARRFFDASMPDADEGALRGLRRLAAHATFATRWPLPGAVHVNARARKPLEPSAPANDDERALAARVDALVGAPIVSAHAPRMTPDERTVASLAERCASRRRGLIVCGPAPAGDADVARSLVALAEALGFPLLCEATSQARFHEGPHSPLVCDAFDTALRSPRLRASAPEIILEVGAPPTSGAYDRFVASARDIERVVVAPYGWNDPHNGAATIVVADVAAVLGALLSTLEGQPAAGRESGYARLWARANDASWAAIESELASAEGQGLSEGAVARAVAASVPEGGILAVGNSLPVRAVETYARRGPAGGRVLSQRGANGIDGLIAGALGAASVARGPVTLLLGDVSFLHDLGSLALAGRATVPVVIVVVQNRGGRIFEQLPVASSPAVDASTLAHVTTPHAFDFVHAARLFGAAYARATDAHSLSRALDAGYARAGCTVVEAVVPDHGAATQNGRVWARAAAAVDALVDAREGT